MARRNVAAASNSGSASAQSTAGAGYPASGAIDGNRNSDGTWGSGGGWGSASGLPQWWQVDFAGPMVIDEVDVFTYYPNSSGAVTSSTAIDASFGLTAYDIQYWDGASWQTLTTVTSNTLAWRQFTYSPVTTTKLRVVGTAAADNVARLLEVEAWGDDVVPSDARLTRVTRTALGAGADPVARLTRVRRTALGPSADPVARLTRVQRSVLGRPRQATFRNAELLIGLTWVELTTPSGLRPAPFTDRPLPDPSTYYRGWKEPRVIEWGKIRRALSGFNGEYETSDFQITCTDIDRFLRGLDDATDLVNASAVVRMITDDGRRALLVPRVVYRGVVRDIAPKGGLQYAITIRDPYAEVFYASGQTTQLPRRTISLTDFPNCAQTLVASSASGYQTNGSVLAGVDSVTVDTGVGQFASGDRLKFAGHTTIYAVSTSSWSDPETTVTFTPSLTDPVADNEAITVLPSHTVTASVGQRVPIAYGHLTDRQLDGGIDLGDGQGPVIYVGDRELSDGKVWGEFLWCGHACYGGPGSPSGAPIQMLYFWNEALDDLSTGTFYKDGVLLSGLTLNALATEAASGGRVAIPGYSNWTDLGFTTTYVDYGGSPARRYTRFFLRGILRDWALGIAPAPDNLGGVPLAIDAYGCETVGDGSGSLIQNLLAQYRHAITNWCPPVGDGYQSGPWLTIPAWPDGTPMIDAASFVRADTQSAVYVTDGFRGDFVIGANNEAISARQLLARFNVSAGVDSGFNRDSQYFVVMINRDLGTTPLQAALGWVRDIFSKTFTIESRTRELYTAIPYRHTQDYLKRDPSGWRSVESGETDVENPAMSTLYGAKTASPELDLYMVRGKNRDSDADEYTRGSETAAAVLALKLARYATVQHLAALQTGPAGFNYELGEVVPITHYEGVGSDGWTDVPNRIERIEVDPGSYTTTLETYDLRPVLES